MSQDSTSHPSLALEPTPCIRQDRFQDQSMVINWRTFDPSTVDKGGDDSLIAELLTYKKNLDLLHKHKGEYVLIKGEQIVGYYPHLNAALDAGAERFGEEPALIKEIVEIEQAYSFGGLIG